MELLVVALGKAWDRQLERGRLGHVIDHAG